MAISVHTLAELEVTRKLLHLRIICRPAFTM